MRRGALRGPGGAAGSGRAVRCGSRAVRERCGEVRCCGAAVPDWALAARALASPLSLTQTSLLQLSPLAIGLTSPTGTSLLRGAHWLQAARRSCSDYHISASGGAAAPALGGNFSSLLICISLYTFFLSLSSIPAAYLPSRLSFSFPTRAPAPLLGLAVPYLPFPYINRDVYFHVYVWVGVLIRLFPFPAFLSRQEPLFWSAQARLPWEGRVGRLAGHGPSHGWDCLFVLQSHSFLQSRIKASCISIKL